MSGGAIDEARGLIGRTFGEFVIREALSSGGFGTVFRAEQPALEREAVIKVLHTRLLASQTVVQRFLREARLASRLDHPYAAHTYAFGAEPDGVLWIAMELVRGTPLDRMLQRGGPIPLERLVPLIERICEVVHTAHEQGIVHRDIKPANVMVLARAGRLLPKLLDFGIAKVDSGSGAGAAGPPAERLPQPAPGSVEVRLVTGADTPPDGPGAVSGETDAASDETGVASGETGAVSGETGAASDETGAASDETGAASDETLPAATTPPRATPTGARRSRTSLATSQGEPSARLTHVGATMGSPLYMAPEQWDDAAAVSPRTDIYALGVLCYEALTGRPPFRAASHAQLAYQHAHVAPPPLGDGYPPALDQVLARALAKDPDARFPSALEFGAALRSASGIEVEAVVLPRVDDDLRAAVMAAAPLPLARAVAALDRARNVHQARDALWQLVRVAVRLVGVTALAAHSHVHADVRTTAPDLADRLRLLRGRSLADADWLGLARELTAPFAALRDAHPLPELVDFLHGPGSGELARLLELRGDAGDAGGSEPQVRELLEITTPLVSALLRQLGFLNHYPLVVPTADGLADEWMGARGPGRSRRIAGGPGLAPGRPVLVDAAGAAMVQLWPFVQLEQPAPGVPATLFLLEGSGRRGARLVALPDTFEREDESLWQQVRGLLRDTEQADDVEVADEVCPFPGLASFTADDAQHFFGRERESQAFLNRLRVTPLLAVVGPSGAGKSSFVQAGVLPGLPPLWQSVVVRPGPAPLESLLARLGALGLDVHDVREELPEHPGALASALRSYAAAQGTTLVLVVDQLEELFTLCDDPAERERYVDVLVRAARSVEDPVRLVFTLRDDFLLRAEALPALRSRLGQALELLTTPAATDLRRILTEPLRQVGYQFDDPGLPGEMVEAVADAPGALALLSFTARQLWQLRDRRFRQLGHRAYRSLGGVGGALAQHAEDTLKAMHPEEQRLVREVFRHAVTAEGTRAVLSREELDQILGSGPHAGPVVEKLLAARLLVSESETGGERIEVIHEALLDAWPRLVTWRREDAEGARLRDQLRAAARQWDERERPSGLLWRGDALAEYRLWRARYPGALTAAEEAFAAASLADVARSRRRSRLLIGFSFAVLVVFAVVLLFMVARVDRQRAAAVDARARSTRSERAARASAAKLHAALVSQYEAQGRRLLLADQPLKALAYLARAAQLGASGFTHDFLVTEAVRRTDGQELELQHQGAVRAVRFSPDGERLASASFDGTARLWDAHTGALLATLIHGRPVTAVSFSPDGKRLVTASLDGTAAVWNSDGGRRLWALDGAKHGVENALFSPDGALVITVGRDDSVKLWSATTGKREAVLFAGQPAQRRTYGAAAFSPDGALLAVGDMLGSVRVWNLRSRRRVALLRGHTDQILAVHFSPDGRRLVAASSDATASVWAVATWSKLWLARHDGPVNDARFTSDSRRVVTGSSDRTAVVWDAATGAKLRVLSGQQGEISRVVVAPDDRWIATASQDTTAMLWDATTGQRLARWQGHRGAVLDMAVDPAGRRLATAGEDARVIVWAARPQARVTRLTGHSGDIYRVDFSSDGTHLVTAGRDGTARLWDASTGRQLLLLKGHQGPVFSARISPDGETIATAGGDKTVRLWDAASGRSLAVLRGHTRLVRDVAWLPDGRSLISVSDDGSARVWSARGGPATRVLQAHDGGVFTVSIAPGGDRFATIGNDSTLRLWRTADLSVLAAIHQPDALETLQFSRGGTRLLAATFKQQVLVLSAKTGKPVVELAGHMGSAQEARWGDHDRLIVTGGLDNTVRLWDGESGNLLQIIHAGEGVWSVAFSSDGRRVAFAGDGSSAEVWTLPRMVGPADFERVLRCRVPYTVQGDRVVSRGIDGRHCAPGSARRP